MPFSRAQRESSCYKPRDALTHCGTCFSCFRVRQRSNLTCTFTKVRPSPDHRGVNLIFGCTAGFKDLTGHTFDRWTVIAFAGRNAQAARRGDANFLAAISVATRRRNFRLRSTKWSIPLCTQSLLTSFRARQTRRRLSRSPLLFACRDLTSV